MYSKKWESINKTTSRLKVPGGWLVRTVLIPANSYGGYAVSMIFISDSSNAWLLEE